MASGMKTHFALLALVLILALSVMVSAQADPGPWFVFVSAPVDRTDLFVMSVATRAIQQLTSTTDAEDQPAWSWDGSRIAYRRSGDVWTMGADGSAQTNQTPDTSSTEEFPFWLPDGRLGFTSDRSGQEELYLLATPDWTPLGIRGRKAAASFDGGRLCYTRNLEIYWAPLADPSRERNISRWREGSDHDCVWKPGDSSYLLVHSHRPYNDDHSGRLWLADWRGTYYEPPVTPGTDDTEGDTTPAWHSSGWILWTRHVGCTKDKKCWQQPEKTEVFALAPTANQPSIRRLTVNGYQDSDPFFKP